MVERSDWPLIMLARASKEMLTPVQIQKCLFLLAQEGNIETEFYNFVPYNYGPFSQDIYQDLSMLGRLGLVRQEREPSANWSYYIATHEGVETAMRTAEELPPSLMTYIDDVVRWVKSKSFSQLVGAIYKKYPEYRVNSIFSEA